jgi:uncharacterized membrane protein
VSLLFGLTLVSALGCGLMAGAFYAFSSFVMKAFARLPPAQGIAAMQSVNVTAVRPAFLAGFLGTALACLALAVLSALDWHTAGAAWRLAGSLLYLAGCFLETIVFHVPRNDALARVDPESAEGAAYWERYLREWIPGNHVRAVACLAAAAVLTIALCLAPGP